jgi:hypothetical protein
MKGKNIFTTFLRIDGVDVKSFNQILLCIEM